MPCDYKKYPANWKSEIRPRILERDGHKCKFCGVPNHAFGVRTTTGGFNICRDELDVEVTSQDGFKVIRIVLTIAHLNHDTTDNRDENLAALCQRCHNRHDVKYRAANRGVTFDARRGQARMEFAQ